MGTVVLSLFLLGCTNRQVRNDYADRNLNASDDEEMVSDYGDTLEMDVVAEYAAENETVAIDRVDYDYETRQSYYSEYHRGTIHDRDGWCNVRAAQSKNAEIVGRLDDGDEVLYQLTGSNWYQVYDPYTEEFLGYVHKSRIR